jgi:Flp pilus assembly pilin Flp
MEQAAVCIYSLHTMNTPQRIRTQARRRGQGMTEYIIIVALIAIAAIGVITLFGDNIRRLFGMSADALAGDVDVANRAVKSDQGKIEKKDMKSFGQNNSY